MLLIFQSIIVYGLMMWVMNYFGNIAYRHQYPQGFGSIDRFANKNITYKSILTKSYFIIPIFIFCLFSAIRYQVGVDCEHYKQIFYDIGRFGESISALNIEVGFVTISKLIYNSIGSHYVLFFVLAFLEIFCLYYAQRKTTYSLKFFGVVLILSGTYLSLMNGMRQYIAACVFVALVPLVLEKKKWVWFVLGVLLATLIHKSALLLLPLGVVAYFLQYKIPNRYVQLGVVAVCFALMDKIDIGGITHLFSQYGAEAGYDDRAIEIYSNLELMNKNFGIRSLLLLATYIITMWYSENMKSFFDNKVFNIQYNIFFIGTCLFLLFYNDFTIGRLLYYLKIFIPIIIASCLYYLHNSKFKIDLTVYRIVILFLILHFLYELYASLQTYPLEYSLYKFNLFR